MEDISSEQVIMELIVNGGDGRSKALEAIGLARKGDFTGAQEKIDQCNQSLNKAHIFQTSLIQAEAGGESSKVSLLMVHGQDHLMNAITVRDLAIEMVELYKNIKN